MGKVRGGRRGDVELDNGGAGKRTGVGDGDGGGNAELVGGDDHRRDLQVVDGKGRVREPVSETISIVNQSSQNLAYYSPESEERLDLAVVVVFITLENQGVRRSSSAGATAGMDSRHRDPLHIAPRRNGFNIHNTHSDTSLLTFPFSEWKCPKAGISSSVFGKVSDSLPEGLCFPKSTSAMASPEALPRYHA